MCLNSHYIIHMLLCSLYADIYLQHTDLGLAIGWTDAYKSCCIARNWFILLKNMQ